MEGENWNRRREIEKPLLLLLLFLLARAEKRYIKAARLLKNHFNVRSEGMEIRAPCSNTSIQRCTAHSCFVFLFSPRFPIRSCGSLQAFYARHKWCNCQPDKHTISQSGGRERERGRARRGKTPSITQAPFNNLVKRTSNQL